MQLLIYEGLGYTPPKLAHLPMINGPDGKKLSKRHAAVSAGEYRDMGYLPDAVLNYLARLGWSHGDQEIFSRSELIEKFDWASVGRTPAQYDAKKFAFVQGAHLRGLDDAALAADGSRYVAAVGTVKTRATTLAEVGDMIDFYFRDTPSEDEKAVAKFLVPASAPHLQALRQVVEGVTPFTRQPLEAAIEAWLAETGLQMKNVAQPARVAMTGRSQSPGLFEVMEVLGRERTLARLDAALTRCGAT